jgi:hypothetical protein
MSLVSLPVVQKTVKPFIGSRARRCKDLVMRKAFRRAVLAGIIAGVVYAIWRAVQSRIPATAGDVDWETAPFPFPPAPRPAPVSGTRPDPAGIASAGVATEGVAAPDDDASTDADAWIPPVEGACPVSHPVKAKLASGIFHVPGGQNYARTKPDRCYRDADAAIADGLRRSQR